LEMGRVGSVGGRVRYRKHVRPCAEVKKRASAETYQTKKH